MFLLKPPTVRALSVWTSMPAQWRKTGVRSSWADANRGGKPTDSFLEGPVVDRHGHLYVTDIPFGRIFRISPEGQWHLVAEYDGEPNGMKFWDEQTLLVTDYKNGLVAVDIASGTVKPWLTRRNSESFKGVNDLCIDAHGRVYFTDQGQTGLHDPTGRVYRYTPQTGQLDLLLTNVPSPNGVVLSPDEQTLYVAATRGNCVWRMPLQADGSVSKVGQFFTSYGASGPDGLAMDETGRLLVANPGLGYVWVLNPRGEPEEVLTGPTGISLTNLAFGGPDRRTVYCTDSTHGQILCADMPIPGVALHQGAVHHLPN